MATSIRGEGTGRRGSGQGGVGDRKSYLLTFGLTAEEVQALEGAAKPLGFSVQNSANTGEIAANIAYVKHCLGVFVRPGAPAEDGFWQTFAKNCSSEWIEIRFFERNPTADSKLLVGTEQTVEQYLTAYLQEIFPQKFKELGLFAVQTIVDNMVPDLQVEWNESDPSQTERKASDFLIFYETNADGFSGGVTIRSSYEFLRSKSKILGKLGDDALLQYCAEMGNQILGVVNYNLKKLQIEARIGLPMLVGKEGIPHFKRRSAFYMPSVTYADADSGISASLHFLVPFLRGATFSHDFTFEVGNATDDEAVTLL